MNRKEEQSGGSKHLQKWKIAAIFFIIFDYLIINLSYLFGLWAAYDFEMHVIPSVQLLDYAKFSFAASAVIVVFFWFMRMYRSVWRYTGLKEMAMFLTATVIAAVAYCSMFTLFCGNMPIPFYVIGSLSQMVIIVLSRISYRLYVEIIRTKSLTGDTIIPKRVMIIGAGAAGGSVVRELFQSDKMNAVPVCMIDDNPERWNLFIEGVPIVGGRDEILASAKKYAVDQIYFCIPTATAEQRRDILNICKETDCELKILPGIYQFVNDEVLVSNLKPVGVEELLGREQIKVDMDEIFRQLTGKVILVTGGGGSIGSELCRQIAEHAPKQLIIFDIYENNAYEIQQELRRKHPDLDLQVLIGSVRDSRRLEMLFSTYKPEIVYHAAAHKHVPLMEDSPNEAIKNNVIGTYKTASTAVRYGVKRFVLISTDKAVNPTNIMGASKRLCEMVVQSVDAVSASGRLDLLPNVQAHDLARTDEERLLRPHVKGGLQAQSVEGLERKGTQFVAVRFGNVLGSNGSVIPLFKKQIEEGGPVTVTHPDIVRYFMTIPEAVSLVLQAGCYAWGGEIFVLDMGEPVKIDTLARNLIQLSGYKPDVDIKIVYSGLRPGEKLFEEKLMAEEGLKQTKNKLIFIGKPLPFDVEQFLTDLVDLADACYHNSPEIVGMVEKIVTTFHPVGKQDGK